MARWAAREPAAALVVPRAEKRIAGGGEMDFTEAGHVDVSVEIMEDSSGDASGKVRRASA